MPITVATCEVCGDVFCREFPSAVGMELCSVSIAMLSGAEELDGSAENKYINRINATDIKSYCANKNNGIFLFL